MSVHLNKITSRKELARRRRLGYNFFEVGTLYRLNQEFMGLVRSGTNEPAVRVPIPEGTIVLCTKLEPKLNGSYAIIEFLFKEHVLHYNSNAYGLSEVMDPFVREEEE